MVNTPKPGHEPRIVSLTRDVKDFVKLTTSVSTVTMTSVNMAEGMVAEGLLYTADVTQVELPEICVFLPEDLQLCTSKRQCLKELER